MTQPKRDTVAAKRGRRMTPLARLQALLKASPLSHSAYARGILLREPRTLRRWLSGESPIPKQVCAWLAKQSPPT